MNIEGNDFHLIGNYYAFIFLNIVVFKMNTSIDLNVEIWLQRKINFKMLITKVQKNGILYNLLTSGRIKEGSLSVPDLHTGKFLISLC